MNDDARPGPRVWPRLFGLGSPGARPAVFDPAPDLAAAPTGPAETARALAAAFLIRLAGPDHPLAEPAGALLRRCSEDPAWRETARLFTEAGRAVPEDMARAAGADPEFAAALRSLETAPPAEYSRRLQERIWSVFFPEGTGIRGREGERTAELRQRRRVRITALNPAPLTDPVRQILWTANVLLAPPPAGADLEACRLEPEVRRALPEIMAEPQVHWYDHPVRIGTAPEHNEVLYGLRHLDEAVAWEIRRGRAAPGTRAACVLSVSVTHRGLGRIARLWLESELAAAGGLKNLDLFVFTERDTERLVERALAPLADPAGAEALAEVFGVDGAYGRHYSFLKAVAALWQAWIDPGIRAVFKIDLDQVFPQAALEQAAGGSMAELLRTPLWGARGIDADGIPVELDMIAGALVNERDIARGLFTPDVPWPIREPEASERLFWSRLPQALSTEAEMMAKYGHPPFDGRTACLQRVHVTGGTNGILIEALRRHQPFTPSFVGRAEDQAYLLSTAGGVGPRLGYVHCPGLVMRHDKESFACDAVRAARVGKAVGDILRVLQFSAYARASGDVTALKSRFDPFTGCFISRIPRVVALLRLALESAAEFRAGRSESGLEFVRNGAARLRTELDFTDPATGELERRLALERSGWAAYYESLAAAGSAAAGACREAAADVIRGCRLRS